MTLKQKYGSVKPDDIKILNAESAAIHDFEEAIESDPKAKKIFADFLISESDHLSMKNDEVQVKADISSFEEQEAVLEHASALRERNDDSRL
jgi:hypothetical protein